MPKEEKTPAPAPGRQKYKVLRGLNWLADPNDPKSMQRAEPGDIRDDLIETSLPWLLADGLIEKVEE